MYKPTKIFFKRELPRSFFYSFSIFFALFVANAVLAWTGPSAAPPGGNTPAPVNVGSSAQTKTGILQTGDFGATSVTVGATANAASITAPQFCIGAACITSWAGAGGGQWITSGTNIYNANTGNVGIGTTGPTSLLHLYGSSTTLTLQESDNTKNSNINFVGSGGGVNAQISFVANADLAFTTSGSEKMRILSGGNVGIGTVSPGYKLDVSGTGHFTGTVDATASLNNWAGIFRPNGAYGIYTTPNSSGVWDYLGYSGYGLQTNGEIYTSNGGADITASLNNWAGIFRPNGAYGIYTTPNSSGVYAQLVNSAYGLNTNGAVLAQSNNANYWAGDFEASGGYGMYVHNASGYYAEIAYSSYGILTNGSVNAPTFCLNGSCISSWSQATAAPSYTYVRGGGFNSTVSCNYGDSVMTVCASTGDAQCAGGTGNSVTCMHFGP